MKHLKEKTIFQKKYGPQVKKQRMNGSESNPWFMRFCLGLTLVLGMLTNTFSQETWTGTTDGDWTKNANWADNSAPLSGVIAGTGILTINAATNAPTTNLPATIVAKQLLVMSPFTIPTGVTVNVDGASLALDGVVTSTITGNLTVLGILNVMNANMNGLEIGEGGTSLFNHGSISISNSGANGFLLTGTGASVITGTLDILNSSDNGIQIDEDPMNLAKFDNQLTGKITITKSENDGIQNGEAFENSGTITIDTTTTANGIENTITGTFNNDSLATLTISNIGQDGINTTGNFNNNGGNIILGNGNSGGIGDNAIEIGNGVAFNNNSSALLGGGRVTISGVNGNAIELIGTLNNGSLTLGDSLGIITIDSTNGNGINLNNGSLTNRASSQLLVGFNGGGVAGVALTGIGTFINTNATARFNGTTGASTFSGPLMHTGDCAVLEITGASSFGAGSVNNAVILSTAPANSVTYGGSFTNNGIISDLNNSFENDLTPGSRTANTSITNTGIIVAPYTAMCYTDTIENFLITTIPTPITFPYLPNTTFTMGGNPNAATLDTLTNRLILHEVQSLMDFTFDINLNGTSCNAAGATSLSFENLPNTFLACVGNLQVTLINDCRAVFKPENLLANSIVCSDGYKIGLIGGTMGDSLIIDGSSIGKTLQVMVTSPLGNSCWTTLSIEDKTAPVCQDTRDTSFFCGQAYDPASLNAYPLVVDGCSAITDTIAQDNFISSFADCGVNIDDPDTLKHIQRTWVFTDASGNSTSCVQNIYELKPTLAMVKFPSDLVDTAALSCKDGLDEAKIGAPFVVVGNNDTVLVSTLCRFGLEFVDNTININSSNKQRIIRTWFVTDWCNSNLGKKVEAKDQIIEIVDNEGPIFTTPPASSVQVIGAANHNCSADVIIPPLTNLVDSCSATADLTVTIIGPSNTIFGNGGTMPSVPFGTHDIIYLVEDPSGNITRDTISVTVDDVLPPVAIGQDVFITLIDNDIVTWVYANSFDGGSHDNCSIDSFLVKKSRVDTFATSLAFDCFDVGLDTIMIRVVDTAGNVSISWARVKIEDKGFLCSDDRDNAPTRWEDLNNDGDPTNDFTIPGTATPDYLNPDDDGDGVPTLFENPDPNGDGSIVDAQDTDGDGIPDFRDVDDDNDGIWTINELSNEDNDETTINNAKDTNGDGIADYLDKDDDGDSIFTIFEGANPVNGKPTNSQDTDGDGIPDYLDDNDDGDGVATRFEAPDANNDGNPDDAKNTDNAGAPDYLDPFQNLTSFATIAGHIQNENGELIEAVNISIGGYEMTPVTTGANGTFTFEEIPLEGNYMITPEKDMNYGNGITTFDIVLLSKHVLGLKPLDSPYKMIAADINHSGTISAYDMVLLRQVILGVKEDFPNNTSWRFIDADYEFLRPENPFTENYPEAYEINSLATDMMRLDFVGVKIGDVNNSASANLLMTAESRNTNKSLNFQIAEQVKKAGETVTVDFKASNFQSILGYQFTLDFDGNALDFEQILISEKAGFENFNLSMIQRGMITTSWSQPEAVNIAADEVLFSLVFKAKEHLRLSEVIQIGSDITAAEAYTGTEELINVNLDVHQPTPNGAGFKLYQNKPNPFTGETIIGFDLPTASVTTMTIFDMSGKVVKVIGGAYEKGYNQILIDGKAFKDHGMFYYQLATGNGIETKKMILLKQ